MKKIMKISAIGIALLLVLFFVWHVSNGQTLAQAQQEHSMFKGKILAASDADMLATAYADGILNKVAGIADTLSLVEIGEGRPQLVSKKMVSNSVVSWPSVVAWNKAKKLAYVAETRGIQTASEQRVKDVWEDLPKGSRITVVDYQNPGAPEVIQAIEVGENIQGVSVNAEANLLVAGSTEKGKEIMLASLEAGKIGQRFYFTNKELLEASNKNIGVRSIEFHPSKDVIAVNFNDTHLVIYRVNLKDSVIAIDQLGPALKVAKKWSVGNWHPSGKYFILTDVAWGNGNMGAIFNGKGKLVSVAYDEDGNHKMVASVKVGLSPEGFDISPDGTYAIVANMRRTYGPKKFWFIPARKHSSLSLVKINGETGELTKLGKDYGFEGALPEDAIFDIESNSIAVAIFHQQDEPFPSRGWIDFWEVEKEQLIKTQQRLYVTRGVHNLLLIE